MTTPRKPRTAIVPKRFLGVAITTAVPACALALAQGCSSDGPRTDYTFVGDVSAHFDRIFQQDVSAHFDDVPDVTEPLDAADAADAPSDAVDEDAG